VVDPKAKRAVRWTPVAAAMAAILMALDAGGTLGERCQDGLVCLDTDFTRRQRSHHLDQNIRFGPLGDRLGIARHSPAPGRGVARADHRVDTDRAARFKRFSHVALAIPDVDPSHDLGWRADSHDVPLPFERLPVVTLARRTIVAVWAGNDEPARIC